MDAPGRGGYAGLLVDAALILTPARRERLAAGACAADVAAPELDDAGAVHLTERLG